MRQRTRDMSLAAIDVTPRDIDWSVALARLEEDGDTFLEAIECHNCNKTSVRRPFESECPKCHAEGDPPEGPMMNYWYPLGYEVSDERALGLAWEIRNLPLCMVRVNDEWGMALTGGGMDLSWQICEAYMRLGLLPPVHFTPPEMCGRGTSKTDRWIVRGYVRACHALGRTATRNAQRARDALAFGERYEAEQKIRDQERTDQLARYLGEQGWQTRMPPAPPGWWHPRMPKNADGSTRYFDLKQAAAQQGEWSAAKDKPLTPPDRDRCQAEKSNGNSFMTLGGRPGMERCTNKPVVIATERQPGPDGRTGSMSLCGECWTEFQKRMPDHATFEFIKE